MRGLEKPLGWHPKAPAAQPSLSLSLSLQTCTGFITNQGTGKTLHGFYSFKFFNNYHSDQCKFNNMEWGLVLFKTVGIMPPITTDPRFHVYSFCKVGAGCSGASATQGSCVCTWNVQSPAQEKDLSAHVFGLIKTALKLFCPLLKPVIPFYRHAVTSHLVYHLLVSFL